VATASRDYYRVLGIEPGATGEAVDRAYRDLVQQIEEAEEHYGPNDELTRFRREVGEAYTVLRDPDRRREFDRLSVLPEWMPVRDEEGDAAQPSKEVDPSALFDNVMRRLVRVVEGESDEAMTELLVPFEVAALGGNTRVRVPIRFACPECGGTGAEDGHAVVCAVCEARLPARLSCDRCGGKGWTATLDCDRCGGDGWIARLGVVRLEIPPGVADGTVLPQAGRAADAFGQARPRFRIRVSEHPFFSRKGWDILCQVPVSETAACSGATIEVKTIRGQRRKVRIPAQTLDGTVVRLPGEGIESEGVRGDQLVEIRVVRRSRGRTGGRS
jgi:molecular chaperone DnaJ